MNKPILAALGAFTGSSVAVLVVSYLKQEAFAYVYAVSLGLPMAFAMYAVARWKQQKSPRPAPSDDS